MISLFLGLHIANMLILALVFSMGWMAIDPADQPTAIYAYHVAMGIGSGLMATLAHVVVYVYFMATTRWLEAAADKADLDPAQYIQPSLVRKKRVFVIAMGPVAITMLALFTGAGADPSRYPTWPIQIHLIMAGLAIIANLACALLEYRYICEQGSLMAHALGVLSPAGHTSDPANMARR